jgi:hypothetical protein
MKTIKPLAVLAAALWVLGLFGSQPASADVRINGHAGILMDYSPQMRGRQETVIITKNHLGQETVIIQQRPQIRNSHDPFGNKARSFRRPPRGPVHHRPGHPPQR